MDERIATPRDDDPLRLVLLMTREFHIRIDTTRFDEHYRPSATSRITTNFANLARGEHRQQNLRTALQMIDRRFDDLIVDDESDRDRYAVELEIVSVAIELAGDGRSEQFPLLEVLDTRILDRRTGDRHRGIVGNNLSSYIRDVDFSVLLPAAARPGTAATAPDGFGDLHGRIFRRFVDSEPYRERFALPPVVCISVSTSRTYRRTETYHPVLGAEYRQDAFSITDEYFAKMGLAVRYFMPPGSVAPLAFYFSGDLLGDYTHLQLAGTIATMETFQRIYRPEIYNANRPAGDVYRPSLENRDYSPTPISYDRAERSRLAIEQARYVEAHLLRPHRDLLERWASPAAVGR